MAVTAEQLREWATNAEGGQTEVERRIVASRHYYATFHKCRPLAQARGLFTDAGGVHAQVIDALTREPIDRSLQSIGYKLQACRNERGKADYDIDEAFTEIDGQAMKRECEAIWELVDRIGKAAPRAAPKA